MKYLKTYEMINFQEDWEEDDPSPKGGWSGTPYIKNGVSYGVIYADHYNGLLKSNRLPELNPEDWVLCTADEYDDNTYIEDMEGEIVDFNGNEYLIYFDEHIHGHDDNNIPGGHGWWVNKSYIEKA